MNEITALTKDKLLFVLGFIGNHGDPIPISYIQCLYDKYGDTYNFETDKCEMISENCYWRNGWKDKNGSFANDFQKYSLDKKHYGKCDMHDHEEDEATMTTKGVW